MKPTPAEMLAASRELGFAAGQGYLLGRPTRERGVDKLDFNTLLPTGLFSRIIDAKAAAFDAWIDGSSR